MNEELNIDREVLFFRYSNNLATPLERDQVEMLLTESPELLTELKAVQYAAGIEKKIREVKSYDISGGYKGVQQIIRKTSRKKQFILIFSRVAAILALPLLISTLIFGYIILSGQGKDPVLYAEMTAAPGTISRFELPDKSKVWLNSNAVLRYPSRFEDAEREVYLEGEAYFEVESDREHPFSVSTSSGMKAIAHGTHFNVNTEKSNIETILAEGKVAIFYRDQVLQEMNPSELASFCSKTQTVEVEKVNLAEKLAWKDGKIIFRNAPLNEVFEQLSRRYNIDIVLHDEHNQAHNYLSRVTFTDETIQQIFSYLQIAAPIEWKLSTPLQNHDSTLVKQRVDVWLRKK